MKNDNEDLKAKTIVITGASSGAGRAIAEEFAKHGAMLVLAARGLDKLEEVAAECRLLGGTVKVVETDVTLPHNVLNLAAAAEKFGKKIDVWINNAGVLAAGPFDEMPIETHTQVIRTNLLGYLHGAHAVIPYFKKQQRGVLINNISIGAFLPVPYGVGYSASKFGIRGLSEALQAELSGWKDIHVCNIYPAFLDTPGMQHAANHTGKAIKPMPPVHDPSLLAKRIVRLALHPKNSSAVHLATIGLRLTYSLFPSLIRTLSKKIIGSYLQQAEGQSKTDGNLFFPLAFGSGTSGGWRAKPETKARASVVVIALLAGVGLISYIIRKK